MNFIGGKNSDFDFRLPRKFIPEEVAQKYRPYLERKPGALLPEPIDYVNYAIQSLSVPGVSYDPINQSDNPGTTRYYRSNQPVQNTIERNFTVNMQFLDGFINYFIMQDTLLYYYARSNEQKFVDNLNIKMHDRQGYSTVYYNFMQPVFTSISELELNFNNNVVDFSTFEIGFYYNQMNIKIEVD